MKRHHTLTKHSQFDLRECKCIPHRGNKINFSANYVLRNILEKLRLFHDSSKEEVDWLTLPGEQSTQRRLVPIWPARDSQMTVTLQTEKNVGLVSADARGGGSRGEALRMSAWEARFFLASNISFSEYVVHRSAAINLWLSVKRDRSRALSCHILCWTCL